MVQINVGDVVTVEPQTYDDVGGYGATRITDRMNESGKLRVTRAYTHVVVVRGPILPDGSERSINVGIHRVLTVNGVDRVTGQPPVVPRRLGEKPEDTDEMTHIDTDDPRIQWLFRDMAAFAENQNWCRQYDDLAEHIGIPGREQEYEIGLTRNGIDLSATISARSETDARAKLEALLVDAE